MFAFVACLAREDEDPLGVEPVVRSDARAPRPAAEAPADAAPAAPEPARPFLATSRPVPVLRTIMRRRHRCRRRGWRSSLAPESEERDASGEEVVAAVEKGEDEDLPELEVVVCSDGPVAIALEDAPVAIALEDAPRTTPLKDAPSTPSTVAPEEAEQQLKAEQLELEAARLREEQEEREQQQLEAARRERAEVEEFYAQKARALEAEVERLQRELCLRQDSSTAHATGHAPVPVEPVPAPCPVEPVPAEVPVELPVELPVEPVAPVCPSPATPVLAARGVLSHSASVASSASPSPATPVLAARGVLSYSASVASASAGRPVLAPARLAPAPQMPVQAGKGPSPMLAAPPRLMSSSYGAVRASHGLVVAPPVYVQPAKPLTVTANGDGVTTRQEFVTPVEPVGAA